MKCKRILSLSLAAAMLFGSAAMLPGNTLTGSTNISASAADTAKSGKCGDNVFWSLKDDVLTISGTGDMYDYEYTCSPFYENIDIKSVVIKEGVTSIGSLVFQWCRGIESVSIPSTVKRIGEFAFLWCLSLRDVTIPSSVTSIGNMAFRYCTGLKSVTIEKGLTSIGYGAFYWCTALTSVSIPDSITSIGNSAFYNCETLPSVTIPSSVTSIGNSAFWGCNALKTIDIPKSVTSIGGKAFSGSEWLINKQKEDPLVIVNGILINANKCSGDVTIPSSVRIICDNAFDECTSLTGVTIPSSVTSIGNNAFYKCTGLTGVAIPDSVTSIGDNAFYDCTNIAGVTIPGSVKSIGEMAFYNCTSLTELTIPGSAASIGNKAFLDCKGLTSITMQNGVKNIGDSAFSGCTGITGITIPSSVTGIGEEAFSGCKNLADVTIPSSVTSIGGFAFSGTKWLTDKRADDPLVVVNGIVIDALKCSGNVTIPSGVTSIGDSAFHYCTDLTGLTIPSSVKSIGSSVFYNCRNLSELTISDGVESIGKEAFYGCDALKCITIPRSVVKISDQAMGYNSWSSTEGYKKIDGFSIRCYKDRAGEKYAKDNGFEYTLIEVPEPTSTRLAGSNRFGTAAEIAKATYDKAETVILAYGLNYADALAGVPLAEKLKAPILLTNTKSIPRETTNAIEKLGAKNVIILGGEGAISKDVEKTLKNQGLTTKRLAGKTRFETAAAIADEVNPNPTEVFFVYALNSADALSVSTVAALKNAPIIYLTTNGELNADTAAYLAKLKKTGSVENAYFIGGKGVISDTMAAKALLALGVEKGKRIAGQNRYETCVEVNTKFKDILTGGGICVAKGLDFPDALAGGVYAAAAKQALFLADGRKLQDRQNTYLKGKYADKLTVFGGQGAVSDELVELIAKASM